MNLYLYVKALHIVFIVTWFSGLFYVVRLFIYQREAQDREEPARTILTEQLGIMTKRLWYGITWPSAIITLVLGLWILHLFGSFPNWLIIKLVMVLLLYGYHHFLHAIYKQQAKGVYKYSSTQLRVINEVATLFLVSIVFLVVIKQEMSLVIGLVGMALFTIILLIGIKLYKSYRTKS